MRSVVMSAIAVASMFLLSGCAQKAIPISQMPEDPKTAEYGVVVLQSKLIMENTTSENIRAGVEGKVTLWETMALGLLDEKGNKKSQIISKTKDFSKFETVPLKPGRYFLSSGGLLTQKRYFDVVAGEIVYIGSYESRSLEISGKLGSYVKGNIYNAMHNNDKEARAYIATIPNLKNWGYKNMVQAFEVKSNDTLKIKSGDECVEADLKALATKDKKAIDDKQVCDTLVVTEWINGEEKTTYHNIMQIDYIHKHTGSIKK